MFQVLSPGPNLLLSGELDRVNGVESGLGCSSGFGSACHLTCGLFLATLPLPPATNAASPGGEVRRTGCRRLQEPSMWPFL
jgi:hypothetical protein